jgi:hypothetical protein
MASTYTLISSSVLASPAASVTFSSIPVYKDLVLVTSARTDSATAYRAMKLNFNNDATDFYSETFLYYTNGNPLAAARGASNTTLGGAGGIFTNSNANSADTFNYAQFYIANSSGSTYKIITTYSTSQSTTIGQLQTGIEAGLYGKTPAINRIDIAPLNVNNWVTNSSFYLYGIADS